VRVLLVSEGSHEGHPAEENPQALRAIVRRILPGSASYEWLDVHDLPRGNPFPGKGGGHFKLALKALKYAMDKGVDALVCITDADRRHERIKGFDEAQDSDRLKLPRALGIPVEAFDAWILADHKALGDALGVALSLLPSPEALDGGKGSARHPKQVCRALMQQHKWKGSQAEFYEAVCDCADLEVIAARCPKGFLPFLQRLRKLGERLG
jgi:hypothetical protein